MLFGFILPKQYLLYHLLSFPIIYLHWMTNNNKCILSELEHYLKGTKYDNESYEYVKKLYSELGFNIPKNKVSLVFYTHLGISFVISIFRLINII
jgi:hypothetical protein